MDNRKKQPFIISRSVQPKNAAPTSEKALSTSTDELNTPALPKQNAFLSRQSSFTFHDSAFKSHYNIFRTDPGVMTDLLEKYSQDNLKYRDEDFTQQAEAFITKIAAERRIPKELRARFPLYQILLSICKIFMLNEYEIVVFACSLDHCNWKIEDVVMTEESDFLREFPSNFGVEISDECKMFIMYLLIITFSLKQYLNEKNNVDKIQAYCEKICDNFQTLYNRWTKLSSFQKFNYSAPEINRKFKHLSKKDQDENITSVKDYNMIVDNIMTLTGSYSSKPKVDLKPTNQSTSTSSTIVTGPIITTSAIPDQKTPTQEKPQSQTHNQIQPEKEKEKEKEQPPKEKKEEIQTKTEVITTTQTITPIIASTQNPPQTKVNILSGLSSHSKSTSLIEPKPMFHAAASLSSSGFSRNSNLDFNSEGGGLKIPSVLGGLSRNSSGPVVTLPAFPSLKRQSTEELIDVVNRKLLKKESTAFNAGALSGNSANGSSETTPLMSLNASFMKKGEDNKELKEGMSLSAFFKHGALDESLSIALPGLSKRSSLASNQPLEELHLVQNLNSN